MHNTNCFKKQNKKYVGNWGDPPPLVGKKMSTFLCLFETFLYTAMNNAFSFFLKNVS